MAGHENVIRFETQVFNELLDVKYVVLHLNVNMCDIFGGDADRVMSRPRVITILLHRVKTVQLCDVAELYKRLCAYIKAQMPSLKPRDLFWDRCKQRLMEEMFHNMNANSTLKAKLGRAPVLADMEDLVDDWTPLLSVSEQQSLQSHEKLFEDTHHIPARDCPDVSLQISQNPGFSSASPSMAVPCYTESSSQHLWIPSLRRWMTCAEKAPAHRS